MIKLVLRSILGLMIVFIFGVPTTQAGGGDDDEGGCSLFELDANDDDNYTKTCGMVGGQYWRVDVGDNCSLTYNALTLPGDSLVDTRMDVPFSSKLHPTGVCNSNDSVIISYSLNGGAFTTLKIYTGSDFTGVETKLDTIKDIAAGSTLQMRYTFIPKSGCTNWRLWGGSSGSGNCENNTGGTDCTCVGWPLVAGGTDVFSPLGTLPITLVSFEGRIIEDEIKLTWVTSIEINNDFFTVERSTNGMFYDEIAIVDAVGNSTLNTSYEAWDEFPVEGSAYYRLIQTDEDGGSENAATLSLKYDPDATSEGAVCEFDIRPNPCPGQCNLDLSGCTNSDFISVGLYDAMGRRISASIPVKQGGGFFLNARNNLAPGTYIVMGSTNKDRVSKKIIVQ